MAEIELSQLLIAAEIRICALEPRVHPHAQMAMATLRTAPFISLGLGPKGFLYVSSNALDVCPVVSCGVARGLLDVA
jgi:hypothetical protein